MSSPSLDNISLPPIATPSDPPTPKSISSDATLDASKNARQIVRLVQCPQCSYPLREPVTLPCGNTLCKTCIPELHYRTNISYPATANRLQGFACPFKTCGKEHAVGDYSVDVVLNKVLDIVKTVMEKCRGTTEASIVLSQVQEVDRWAIAGISSLHDDLVRTRLLPGGRLLATYTMAEMGELAYDSEVMYPAMGSSNETEELDTKVFEHLKESARSEMDCQVCYDVFLDPLTTNCGHTLCRQCLHRVLDHSNLCPLCRRRMEIPPGVSAQQASSNALLTKLISSLCHEALDLRLESMRLSDMHDVTELDTPLFICTLSFPCTPTFLHVFEPRYRLMIRRAIESGDRKFGMLLYNPSREPQGELGRVPFYELGTLLHIVNMQLMPDGRSLLETVGVSRFRVVRHGVLDGYTVGKIERIDDVSVTEEEALEAAETSSIAGNFSAEGYDTPPRQSPSRESGDLPSLQELNSIPTKELMDIGVRFVQRMQDNSASWLQRNVVHAYGECPDDPALFPWWFASVIPTSDAEKYKMLSTSSVRERLKMCVVWAAELEAQRWGSGSNCTVL